MSTSMSKKASPTKRKKQSQWKDVWKRLRRNKLAMISLFVIIILVLSTAFADYLAPYDYAAQNYSNRFAYPSAEHLMGTDNFGRDIFSRVLKGGQVSLLVSVSAVAMAMVIGCILGAMAAYFGGRCDTIIMRIMDIIMGIPGFLLAVSISAALGSGIQNASISIAVGSIPQFARIMNSAVLTVKDQEFVEAAITCGATHSRIIFRHIIPNTLSAIIVNATLRIANAILIISSLSFIGLGVQPPTPEWGSILAAGREFIRDFYPIVIFPGLAIMITLIAFNLLGDGLRDAMDPRLKR
ncbi:MAG: ABC transporter permease [Oscillospiraceae bacterium]|jgi:peptide/nickel transport system permease protein